MNSMEAFGALENEQTTKRRIEERTSVIVVLSW